MTRGSRLDRLLPKPLSHVAVAEVVELPPVRRRRRRVVAATAEIGRAHV